MTGPTQQQQLRAGTADPDERSLLTLFGLIVALVLATCYLIAAVPSTETTLSEVPTLFYNIATLNRMPISAQDFSGSLIIILIWLIPIIVVDYGLCRKCMPNAGSRWFLLHAIGNMVVSLGALPDFLYVFQNPPAGLSVAYCVDLNKNSSRWACSEWPVGLIVAMHIYHMMGFKLNADDMFHHLLFVPVIGGLHFMYPWGALGNVLCFFLSGLPGGISYFLLCAVKAGRMSSFMEKRINCSINTWVRGPGIVMFITLALACWARPPPGTPPDHVIPTWLLFPSVAVVFFNGQYYAQRVIGNYYIRKAQDHAKRGIQRVDLHTS